MTEQIAWIINKDFVRKMVLKDILRMRNNKIGFIVWRDHRRIHVNTQWLYGSCVWIRHLQNNRCLFSSLVQQLMDFILGCVIHGLFIVINCSLKAKRRLHLSWKSHDAPMYIFKHDSWFSTQNPLENYHKFLIQQSCHHYSGLFVSTNTINPKHHA